MDRTHPKIVEYLRTIETSYTDQRVLSEQELRALAWFFLYGTNVFSEVGLTWKGCTFRQRETTCLLVVKADADGIPLVAYCTARTPTDCVLSFCKTWHADLVKWNDDKYG